MIPPADEGAVKALVGPQGIASDFRRTAPDPEPGPELRVLHHVGIYGFRKERLLAFTALEPTPREQAERLEQLRALEHGWRVRVLDASEPAFGVDTPADYEAFLARLGKTSPPPGT